MCPVVLPLRVPSCSDTRREAQARVRTSTTAAMARPSIARMTPVMVDVVAPAPSDAAPRVPMTNPAIIVMGTARHPTRASRSRRIATAGPYRRRRERTPSAVVAGAGIGTADDDCPAATGSIRSSVVASTRTRPGSTTDSATASPQASSPAPRTRTVRERDTSNAARRTASAWTVLDSNQ